MKTSHTDSWSLITPKQTRRKQTKKLRAKWTKVAGKHVAGGGPKGSEDRTKPCSSLVESRSVLRFGDRMEDVEDGWKRSWVIFCGLSYPKTRSLSDRVPSFWTRWLRPDHPFKYEHHIGSCMVYANTDSRQRDPPLLRGGERQVEAPGCASSVEKHQENCAGVRKGQKRHKGISKTGNFHLPKDRNCSFLQN